MSSEVDLSRRGLFRNLGAKAKIEKAETVMRSVARPPTAVDEDIFTELCNQRGKCAEVCPESIIHMEKGFPTLDIDYSHCTLCGECKAVCPTIALSGEIKDTGLRAQANNTCINLYGYCDACEDSCSVNALQWQEDKLPKINHDICNGCGACKGDCYIGAISMVNKK